MGEALNFSIFCPGLPSWSHGFYKVVTQWASGTGGNDNLQSIHCARVLTFQHFMVVDVIPIINMQIMSLPEPRGLTPAPQSVGSGAPTWHQSLPSLSSVCTVQRTSEIPASKYKRYPMTYNLKKWSWWTYLENRGTDIENNKLPGWKGGKE